MTEPTAGKGAQSDDWKSFYTNPPAAEPAPQGRPGTGLRGLAWWQLVLSLVPLVLIGLGGLIGGAIGAGAMLVNLKIARSSMPTAAKAISMIAIVGLAFVVWVIVTTIVLSALGAN